MLYFINTDEKATDFLQNWAITSSVIISLGNRIGTLNTVSCAEGDLSQLRYQSSIQIQNQMAPDFSQSFSLGTLFFDNYDLCKMVVDDLSKRQTWTISEQLRQEVFKRDNYTCLYCGKACVGKAACINHLDPDDGAFEQQTPDNLVTCCRSCGPSKGRKNFLEYYDYVRAKTGRRILVNGWPDGPKNRVSALLWQDFNSK